MTELASEHLAATRSCPSCGTAMRRGTYERRPVCALDLDMCFDCQAIWFDQYESAQLTPGSVLEVFRVIHEQSQRPARPLSQTVRCVACRARLQLTHDIQRTNRIVYYRCPEGHGRFTTFIQFLREKNFVRSLTAPEVQRLRAQVAQVRCSSCGAPIDLARDSECSYCHAPIAILDADAVSRELSELGDQERRRKTVNPRRRWKRCSRANASSAGWASRHGIRGPSTSCTRRWDCSCGPFRSEDMTKRFVPAILASIVLAAAQGCATPKEPPPKPFAGTRWMLVLDIPRGGEAPWLRFGDERMEGYGGCNRIEARYVLDTVGAGAIAVGRIETGRRGCDPGVQAAENRMLEVLQAASSYAVTGSMLSMTGSGGTLWFRARDEKGGK
jgi:Zn-finger nucleic acid-binding protein